MEETVMKYRSIGAACLAAALAAASPALASGGGGGHGGGGGGIPYAPAERLLWALSRKPPNL